MEVNGQPGQEPVAPNEQTPLGQEPAARDAQPGQEPVTQVDRTTDPRMEDVNALNDNGERVWFDRSYVEQLRTDQIKLRTEAASLKTQLDAIQAGQTGPGAASQSDDSAANTDVSKYEQKIEALNTRVNQALIANAVIAEAAKSTKERGPFHEPSLAVKLADLSDVTLDDDGNVIGADRAVNALAQKHTYLIQDDKPPVTNRVANPARTAPRESSIVERIKHRTTGAAGHDPFAGQGGGVMMPPDGMEG